MQTSPFLLFCILYAKSVKKSIEITEKPLTLRYYRSILKSQEKYSNYSKKEVNNNMPMTLKAARVNKGLNQHKAAQLLGVSVDTLSNYERAKRFPDVPIIKKMEEVYGTTYDDLIFLP
jgi:ribosome-binding protein aMBF1 (putative translation factor)